MRSLGTGMILTIRPTRGTRSQILVGSTGAIRAGRAFVELSAPGGSLARAEGSPAGIEIRVRSLLFDTPRVQGAVDAATRGLEQGRRAHPDHEQPLDGTTCEDCKPALHAPAFDQQKPKLPALRADGARRAKSNRPR